MSVVVGLLVVAAFALTVRWAWRADLYRPARRKDGVEYHAHVEPESSSSAWNYKVVVWRDWIGDYDTGRSTIWQERKVAEFSKYADTWLGCKFVIWNMIRADRRKRRLYFKRIKKGGLIF